MTISQVSKTNQVPIGIFDSGVGGLSIAKCISMHLPNEQLIYIADTKFSPYGDKSTAFIQQRVNFLTERLISLNCKTIIIACNTATLAAIEPLRKQVSIPIIGVEPAIKPAVQLSKTKKVAILTTASTAKNTRFISLIKQHKQDAQIFIQPCPGLVELIEQGLLVSKQCETLLIKYLTPLLTENIDTLVLGCTHYPFLIDQIKKIVGEQVHVMETALPVTQQLKRQITKYDLATTSKQLGGISSYSSNYSLQQNLLMSQLWQGKIELQPL
ncbi:MAG: glutamate racemase [Alteromonadaceae bacterium]|jgi:glutamate racemase